MDASHQRMYKLLPQTQAQKQRRRKRALTYLEELDQHTFSVKCVQFLLVLFLISFSKMQLGHVSSNILWCVYELLKKLHSVVSVTSMVVYSDIFH